MTGKKSATRGISIWIAATLLAGCHTWEVADVAPQQLFERERPEEVRVRVLGESGAVHLRGPRIEEATILGSRPMPLRPDPTVELPMSAVRQVEVRRFSWAKTTAMVGATLAFSLIMGEWMDSQVDDGWGGGWFGGGSGSVFGCITC